MFSWVVSLFWAGFGVLFGWVDLRLWWVGCLGYELALVGLVGNFVLSVC